MFQPPHLGAGLVYSSFLVELIDRDPGLIDFVEIEPETVWIQSAPGAWDFRMSASELERLRILPCAKLLHSIGFPVGGSCPPDLGHVALLNGMADVLKSPWISEHLSFNTARVGGEIRRTGMLLPPLQTSEGVDAAVRGIRRYAAALNRPLAIETGVNYLEPRPFELSDGSFIRRVVEEADCGILLDLHNLWTNERNGRQKALDVIAELPLSRVWEVHVAGGEERSGYWIDGHCGSLPAEVRVLAREIIPCLPNLGAVTLEVFPAYLPAFVADGLHRELEGIREILSLSRRPFTGRVSQAAAMPCGTAPRVADWEQALADGILRLSPRTEVGRTLAGDSALGLYSELLEEFRASMIGTALGLTTRLLLLHIGEKGMRQLLSRFWRRSQPEMSAAAEAIGFAEFLRTEQPSIPLLDEILSFEIGAVRAIMEQRPQHVLIGCDIRLAIAHLVEGRRPLPPGPTPFEFVIDPPID